MKKILFGIALILMSIAFVFVFEYRNILVVSRNFETMLCSALPFLGFFMCIWGLFERDK